MFDPSDEAFPVGFNVLSAHSELECTLLASDLVGIFRRFSTTFGDQMASILGNAILAFLESEREFPLLRGIPQTSILTRLNTFFARRRSGTSLRRSATTWICGESWTRERFFSRSCPTARSAKKRVFAWFAARRPYISQAAMSRQDEDASKRVPFFLYMDVPALRHSVDRVDSHRRVQMRPRRIGRGEPAQFNTRSGLRVGRRLDAGVSIAGCQDL